VIVLVDYDNVSELERRRGPVYVLARIVDALGTALAEETELRVRLYGGWFHGTNLSRRAQQIVPAIRAEFPRQMSTIVAGAPLSVVVRAELALALDFDPEKYLTHTYRDRSLPSGVRCASLPYVGCKAPSSCPIAPLNALIRDFECPDSECRVDLNAVLTKPEQKLVDTMLTVDVLHLARATEETIAVVSADDDLWPGIQAAVLYGARIVHIHPSPGRTTPLHYASLARGHYTQRSFWGN
jgi:hypothetical protein